MIVTSDRQIKWSPPMIVAQPNGPADMVREDAQRISTRMEVLKRDLASESAPAPILHPAMADMYSREVQKLIKTLNEPDHREEAAGLIRGLIDKIVLTPDSTGTRLAVNLEGDLAGILAMSVGDKPAERSINANLDVFRTLAEVSHHHPELAAQAVVGKTGCGSSSLPKANFSYRLAIFHRSNG